MTDEAPTPLDAAHAAMSAAPEDDDLRRLFYARLLEVELFLLLDEEPGDSAKPMVLPLADGPVALAFDTDARMASFVDIPTPYIALPGRRLVAMLADAGLMLGLNLGTGASESLLPAEVLGWLRQDIEPELAQARAVEVNRPRDLSETLLRLLDAKFAQMAGLGTSALLVEALYEDGARGLLIALADTEASAQPAIASALAEAGRMAGGGAPAIDVIFPALQDPVWARLRGPGLRFDLPTAPVPDAPRAETPDLPPKLR